MKTYKQAIKDALVEWEGGFLRSRSDESKKAVAAIKTVINDTHDNRLKELIDYLTDWEPPPPPSFPKLLKLSYKSKLYACLVDAVSNAQAPLMSWKIPPRPPMLDQSSQVRPIQQFNQIQQFNPIQQINQVQQLNPIQMHNNLLFDYGILDKYKSEWSKIEITDIPIEGVVGRYKSTDNDKYTTQPRAFAKGMVEKDDKSTKAVHKPEFWVILGGMIMNKKGDKFGRCVDCSAAVVYMLVNDHTYDRLVISVIGKETYDHHFVYVGTPDDVENGNGWVIDVWQANLNLENDKTTPLRWLLDEYQYGKLGWKDFCVLRPEDRVALRQRVAKLKNLE